MSVQFTREDARAAYDQLPEYLTMSQYFKTWGSVRMALVKKRQGVQFEWVAPNPEQPVIWTNISPQPYYQETKDRKGLQRQLIGKSVEHLYRTVNQFIEQSIQEAADKAQPKDRVVKKGDYKSDLANWSPDKWDKSKYQPPTYEKTEGYMGGGAWVGSKRSTLTDEELYRTAEIAKRIRRDIKDATEAGYLPTGLKYSVTTSNASMTSSVDIRVTGLGDNRDIYDYENTTGHRRGRELKPKYQEIMQRLKDIQSAYNYDESNAQVDYFSRGYYGRVDIETAGEKHYKDNDRLRRQLNKLEREGLKNSEEYSTRITELDNTLRGMAEERAKEQLLHRELRAGNTIDWQQLDKEAEPIAREIYQSEWQNHSKYFK